MNKVLCSALFLLVLKNPDEQFTDDLALLLGFGYALERLKIPVRCTNRDQVDALRFKEASICSVSFFLMKPVST